MKTKHFLGIVASAWMLAACSNQDELLQQDELVAKQCVTVNAYVPDGTGSRLTFEDQGANGLKVSWNESGESFSVMTAEEDEPVTFTQTEGSEFAGPNGFTFAEGTDYYAYYPALTQDMLGYDPDTEVPLTTVSATAIPFYFYSQSGQLDENMNLMYAKRSAEGDFQFRHMLAVMKFTLKGIQGELVNDVEISFAHESDYYTFGTVDVTGENPVFTAEGPSGMLIPAENLTAEDGNYTIYAYLPPLAAGTMVSIVAYSENEEDNKYMTWRDEFTVNNEGIKAGYYYTAARKMETSEEENIQLNFTAGNVEELKAWIDALNTYSGVNLTLTADIGLTNLNHEFEYDNDGNGYNDGNWPSELAISGTVDGDGHTITNLHMECGEKVALFGEVQAGGVVKNLHLKNAIIGGNKAGGGIAVDNYGTISGCSVSGTSSVSVMEYGYAAGGIVSCNQSDGTVIGCYCSAEVSTAEIGFLGGIVGKNAGTVTACYSTSEFLQSMNGGIACLNGETGTVTTCYWNSASATYGICYDYTSGNSATKVDGESDAWSAAAQAMNEDLPDGFGWHYVVNTDNATKEKEPLVLEKGNNDYVPV